MDERFVLLGEHHGLNTTAKCIREVLARIDESFTFALEFPPSAKQELLALFRGEDVELSHQVFVENPDRLTPPLTVLCKELLQQGVAMACVDVEELSFPNPQSKREEAIANNLSEIPGRVVALLGSLHAAKKPLEVHDKKIVPTGYYLRDSCYSINLSPYEVEGYDEWLPAQQTL